MTREEYLLTYLAQEASEVAQAATKVAMRLAEGHIDDDAMAKASAALNVEWHDLMTQAEMVPGFLQLDLDREFMRQRRERIEKRMRERGIK